ncbi:MAG: hypothetical protein LBE12_06010 [Planctomycetaceae bacterium]|jgi:hypothetical protein|nr:hypothetical protein [Planctomycetaceae bacterium]
MIKITEFENVPGVHVTQFFVSVTFFPEVIESGQSNELFLKIVSLMSDILNENESLLRWSVQSVRTNFLEGDVNTN